MILDAEARADDWFRDRIFDVCVVGSGPAGVTLARRLAARGASVGLFEAGGLELKPESQELYKGETAGQPYYPLEAARLRFFGGSSNHWGGWTRPLDPYDFDPKPHHSLSGWPIRKTDLDPYADEAAAILDLPADRPPPDIMPDAAEDLVPRLFRFSRPITRFGEKYGAELNAAENNRVYVNANLVDLRLDTSRRMVSEAVFRSYHRDEPFSVKARLFVLSLGGIENARALLNADSEIDGGLGNEHDLVGRYFLEHPHAPAGKAVMRAPLTWMLVYSPTPAFMLAKRILNFGIRIGDFDQWNAPDFTGALELQPPCTLEFDTLLAAEMKGEPRACPAHVGDIFIACEQSLDPENRVSLTAERDRFGLRKARLAWRLSELDLRTLRAGAAEIARHLAEHDVGRMKSADWLLKDRLPTADELWGGNHHMGTTRMSEDPKRGVVDAAGRVHSLENLYIGGSSVFSTSGHANPTYTIVQLALRQADILKRRLEAG
jgi:choline dehydrogenase-like flavoprotein